MENPSARSSKHDERRSSARCWATAQQFRELLRCSATGKGEKNIKKTTGRRFEGRGGGVEACGITTEPLRTTIERNNPQQEEREKRNHPGQTKSWKQGV